MIKKLSEIDKSKGYLRYGHSSLYKYMTRVLKYSEGAAIRRMRTARLLGGNDRIEELFRTRKVSLCTLSLIYKEPQLLDEIIGKSKREVEEIVALRSGKSTVVRERVLPVVVRKIITDTVSSKTIDNTQGFTFTTQAMDTSKIEIEERLKLTFSVKSEDRGLIDRAKEVLSNKHPSGASLEEIFLAGVGAIIKKDAAKKSKLGSRESTVTTSGDKRYVPSGINRKVMEKDNYCCSYIGQDGSVCG